MAERLDIALFCEDRGHELLVRALVERIAIEEGRTVDLRPVSSQGGHGRAMTEFVAFQRTDRFRSAVPDLLLLVIDGNCEGWSTARARLVEKIDSSVFPRFVVGCPDPHVERWFMADPPSFGRVIGAPAPKDPGKCERDLYKRLVRETILRAGQQILTSEAEFAPQLVEEMDLFAAGKNQPSLKSFVDDLRAALKRARGR